MERTQTGRLNIWRLPVANTRQLAYSTIGQLVLLTRSPNTKYCSCKQEQLGPTLLYTLTIPLSMLE